MYGNCGEIEKEYPFNVLLCIFKSGRMALSEQNLEASIGRLLTKIGKEKSFNRKDNLQSEILTILFTLFTYRRQQTSSDTQKGCLRMCGCSG